MKKVLGDVVPSLRPIDVETLGPLWGELSPTQLHQFLSGSRSGFDWGHWNQNLLRWRWWNRSMFSAFLLKAVINSNCQTYHNSSDSGSSVVHVIAEKQISMLTRSNHSQKPEFQTQRRIVPQNGSLDLVTTIYVLTSDWLKKKKKLLLATWMVNTSGQWLDRIYYFSKKLLMFAKKRAMCAVCWRELLSAGYISGQNILLSEEQSLDPIVDTRSSVKPN